MRFNFILTFIICGAFLINSCDQKTGSIEIGEVSNFEFNQLISDAPIRLYCLIDNKIGFDLRQTICDNVMSNGRNRTVVVLISFNNDESIKDVEIKHLAYKINGLKHESLTPLPDFDSIVEELDAETYSSFGNISGMPKIVYRIQLERFCPSYSDLYDPYK